MRDYSKDFAEWRKWRDEKGLPPIYDNPADAGIETDFRVGQQVSFTNEYGVRFGTARDNGILQTGASGRCVYLDYDCYWFPTELKSLKTLSEMMSQPTYIASCSFGKDSIATILLALEHDEPLDRVVFSEVMFDHARNISGEIPEHIGWIYDTAIPKAARHGHPRRRGTRRTGLLLFFSQMPSGGRMQERFTGSRSAANASSIGIAKSRPYEIPRRNCWRSPACQNEYQCSTSVSPQTNRDDLPNSRRTECRLAKYGYRADGETALRHSRVTVADLHDRDTRRMLVLPELQNTTFRQPATQSSRTMGRIGRVEPYAELVQLRIQIRPYRAGGRKTDECRRTTAKTFLITTFHERHSSYLPMHRATVYVQRVVRVA